MARRKRKQQTIGSEIARIRSHRNVLAFLHGYFDGGAECHGISPEECAQLRDALAIKIGADKWTPPAADAGATK